MEDIGIIDRFTDVFAQYIDSGFGLLGADVAFLTAALVAIDITLAGLMWAMGGQEDVIAKLLRKTLYVGAFAFILTNFQGLADVIFRSFAGLGLTATGNTVTQAQLLQPGRLASVGIQAGEPIMQQIGALAGFPDFFANIDTIAVMFIAWLIVILSFFILAVQLFVTLIEFKLTTLAGFVLVPFALWNKTAFLAERVLGNVMSAGVKVLVLAVIVGIGGGIFAEFTVPPGTDPTLNHALAIMLASLAMLALGIFGPGIATGLVSGAPQLGAGAAAGTVIAVGGLAAMSGAALMGAARAAGALRGSTSPSESPHAPPPEPPPPPPPSSPSGGSPQAGGSSSPAGSAPPSWAQRLRSNQQLAQGLVSAAHVLRSADQGGSGPTPSLHNPA